ncbi:MAG: beta-propeller fold lactonase family protein [Flavobacteriales bacterium]|nr:beta-propeller fold lactonase family protein [Flavobacteriales bacterium]
MRIVLLIILCSLGLTALGQCPDGEIEDCNRNCQPASWVGDGVCDDGYQFPSDFMCEEFNWDDGDCGCSEGQIEDCNGNCNEMVLIGDGVCHNDEAVNFACSLYNYDGGDCPVICGEDEFMDCDSVCFNNAVLEYLANWHCSSTLWLGWLFDANEVAVNFDCAEFMYDGGDCIVEGCPDPEAINYYEHAEADNGTCFYGDCPEGTMDCMGNCVPENWIGYNECIDGTSATPIEHLYNGAYPNELVQIHQLPSSSPKGLCLSPDGETAYVGTNGGLTIVYLETGQTGFISSEGTIYSCDISPDGQYVFGANRITGMLDIFDVEELELVTSVYSGSFPLKVRMSNNGERVYCSNHDSNDVAVFDASTFELITTVDVGLLPRNIHTSPDDSRLYVSNWLSWTMSVIDTETFETIAEVPVDYWPQAVWALPNDDYVLVANFGWDLTYDHLCVIRVSDWEMIARVQTGAGPEDMQSMGPNGEYLFVSNWGMPCCFLTSYDLCCSAEINKGDVTVIATPDFDAIVAPDEVPTEIPYIISTLTTIPSNQEYTFGIDISDDGKRVVVANQDSNSITQMGMNETVGIDPLNTHPIADIQYYSEGRFEINGPANGYSVNIYSSTGQLVYSSLNESGTLLLNIADQPRGVYHLLISSKEGLMQRSVVR